MPSQDEQKDGLGALHNLLPLSEGEDDLTLTSPGLSALWCPNKAASASLWLSQFSPFPHKELD